MKTPILLLILCMLLAGCSEPTVSNTNSQNKWELVKMSGRTLNSETSGVNMEWQEFYLLNNDGTFIKSRTQNGQITQGRGTYTMVTITNENYIELTYPVTSNIIGSCYGNLKEELYFTTAEALVSTWQNCDGPSLEYRKTK